MNVAIAIKNKTASVFMLATIKIKTVLESLEDFLQKCLAFLNFLFCFLLTRDFRWVIEFFQLPI